MRRWIGPGAVLGMMAIAMILGGCKGDTGPAGPPGTASCMNCHTDQYNDDLTVALATYQAEFEESQHNQGDTWLRRGDEITPECSRCHTNEGHQYYLQTGEVTAVPTSSKINCFTCHAPHTNENFELRQTDPVTLNQGGPFDKGTSNACVVCHQVRNPSPAIADGANITSTRWGPHHGPQGNILSAQGAWTFGGEAYPSDHPHYQANNNGCVTCHMAELPQNLVAGGHSFAINYESGFNSLVNRKGCTCHEFAADTIATQYVDVLQVSIEARVEALIHAVGPDGLGWLSSNGLVVKGVYQADEMGAIWNLKMIEEDLSLGVHNPTFVEAVLDRTEEFVLSQSRR